MHPVIYAVGGTDRTVHVARAMVEGMRRHGIMCEIRREWDGVPRGDVAIAYGWNHERIFKAYPNYAYWDLGYWDRRPRRDKKDGYHRLAVNDWDTCRHMLCAMPGDRLAEHQIELKPWGSKGESVLIAGMSEKAAGTHGFAPGQWERETLALVRQLTTRPIIMREKPKGPKPAGPSIEDELSRSHFVISHHSNVSVDAVIAGVPHWCRKGVGRWHAQTDHWKTDSSVIENPPYVMSDNARLQFLQDVSYAQWRPSEMRTGAAWETIKCILGFS